MADAESSSSIVDRVQGFIAENKRAILIGAAVVVAAGGVAYYASASSSSSRPSSPGADSESTRSKKKKKKSAKKKAAKDTDTNGPILEEIVPPKEKVEEVDVDAGVFLLITEGKYDQLREL